MPDAVALPFPAPALNCRAAAQRAVDLGEGPGLRLAIAPAVAREDAEIARDLLLQSSIRSPYFFVPFRRVDVQIDAAIRQKRLPERACVFAVQIAEHPQRLVT